MLSKYGEIETFCYPYGIFNMYIKGKVRNYYKRAFSVEIGGTNYWDDPYQIVRYTPEKLLSILQSWKTNWFVLANFGELESNKNCIFK